MRLDHLLLGSDLLVSSCSGMGRRSVNSGRADNTLRRNRKEYRPRAGVVPRSRGAAPKRGNQPRRVTGVAQREPRRHDGHIASVISCRRGKADQWAVRICSNVEGYAICPLQRGQSCVADAGVAPLLQGSRTHLGVPPARAALLALRRRAPSIVLDRRREPLMQCARSRGPLAQLVRAHG